MNIDGYFKSEKKAIDLHKMRDEMIVLCHLTQPADGVGAKL